MSTFYYAVCDEHRAISEVIAGRSFPDRWWANNDYELPTFLREHGSCKTEIVSEHDDRSSEYDKVRVVEEETT